MRSQNFSALLEFRSLQLDDIVNLLVIRIGFGHNNVRLIAARLIGGVSIYRMLVVVVINTEVKIAIVNVIVVVVVATARVVILIDGVIVVGIAQIVIQI